MSFLLLVVSKYLRAHGGRNLSRTNVKKEEAIDDNSKREEKLFKDCEKKGIIETKTTIWG